MTIHEGICRGGPLDGQRRVVMEAKVLQIVVPRGSQPPFGSVIHEYRYVLGQWIYRGEVEQ